MADKVYPEGVTSEDHVNHDMKMGRFPYQSSVETFLKERATLAAQEGVAHLPAGASLHAEMVEALRACADELGSIHGLHGDQANAEDHSAALSLARFVLAKATGSKTGPA